MNEWEWSLLEDKAQLAGLMATYRHVSLKELRLGPLLQQLTLGWSAIHAGLTGAWWSLGTIIAMGAGQALVDKLAPFFAAAQSAGQ